ncbi:circadian clock KaiB family protein [Myxosarcina sp. GI1]|uniref:circadian clock KaiB family protein n=1 Tax=Myxosarcina sp. GI1 TaxID=1541065 RepID=UPI0005646AA0|nr:circadian clock KaiB family protein [Myxosarcina sp. GI1]
MCEIYRLKLYVSGDSSRSRLAIANLQEFCDRELRERSEITIIDILKSPEIAEREKILITPTLVKEFPPPQERVIGDLSNTDIVSFALSLRSHPLRQKP